MDAWLNAIGPSSTATLISFGITLYMTNRRWQREIIKRGLALYDPQTGKWRWKEQGK